MSRRPFGRLDSFVGASLYLFCASQLNRLCLILRLWLCNSSRVGADTAVFIGPSLFSLSLSVSLFSSCAPAKPSRVGYACLRVFLRGHFIVLLSFIYLRSGGALAAYAPCLRQRCFNRRGPRDHRKQCAVSPRPVENIVRAIARNILQIFCTARVRYS